MKQMLPVLALALAQSAQATPSLYEFVVWSPPTNPAATWWGSFRAFTDGFVDAPLTFTAGQQGFSCTIVFPNSQQCLGVSFNPQEGCSDKITFATSFGSYDYFLPDGAFTHYGVWATSGPEATLSVTDGTPTPPAVPEANTAWMILAGMLLLGARLPKSAVGDA